MTDLEQLLAREAIKETKARYCRLLDTKQWDDWGQVFTADVEMDVSDDVKHIPGALTLVKGRARVVEQTRTIIDPGTCMHQVHSPEIRFVSATEAAVIWTMEDWITFPDEVPAPFRTQHAFGHYHETYRLDEGVWRIARLRLARLHKRITPRD
ncbi:MAG: nuclear transport factor 2 family protein [Porticoccaceae bacterium]|jgi:hypothetical protein|nr:nuclear transport factor 2 family protein [Porticoccaceae bacterium]HLS97639.1 nuclear transport factor 2 family protein [Porticoccaceae bacterium]